MTAPTASPLVVVDIGNTRLKLGVFEGPSGTPLPLPKGTLSIAHDWQAAEVDAFLPHPVPHYRWVICSVNRPACARLVDWLRKRGAEHVWEMEYTDLRVTADVERPDYVGIDRLANVVAVNRIRPASEPAIIVDMGTALKVDLVSATGSFAGGTIAPGLEMSARALHEYTDLLPLIEVTEPETALGKSTVEAMLSGLYWGAIGAVRELAERIVPAGSDPEIILTGGTGTLFAGALESHSARPPQFVPHLTLAGIAIAAGAGETA